MPNNIMATKIFVLNPRALKTLEEVDDVLDLINKYEKNHQETDIGVGLLQNMQLGGCYRIISRKKFLYKNSVRSPHEFYCRFWPRSYFEGLRKRLNGGS